MFLLCLQALVTIYLVFLANVGITRNLKSALFYRFVPMSLAIPLGYHVYSELALR